MSVDRGLLLILNTHIGCADSQYDADNLKQTFEAMNAEVILENNLDEKDIQAKMKEIKQRNFANYLYVAVAYLAHGTEDDIVTTSTQRQLIKLQKAILIPLCNIPELNGKLKWLIMQNCRGNYDFIKEATEGPSTAIQFPCYCAKFFATSAGMRAFIMLNGRGSYFITALCERLRSEFRTNDIISILNHARGDVDSLTMQELHIRQIPCSEHNFGSKQFYITDGFRN